MSDYDKQFELIQHIAELEAKNAKLQETADMYQWLRDKSISLLQVGTFSPYCVLGQTMEAIDGVKLDAAIRAAMKEKP